MRSAGFAFEDMMRGPFGNFSDHVEGEMIDLNLGNWACLENSWSGGCEKSPSSVFSTLSTTTTVTKRKKPPPQGGSPVRRCQVQGCNLDLSWAKDYHRKNRVCDYHSKSSLVIVEGLERRFCQQCSRFHGLSEFDQLKRSCRKRLSAHNARRRKPQQGRTTFSSPRLTNSSFYDGRKQMNFLLNTQAHTRNAESSDWESTYDSKFTITKGQPQVTGNQLPHAISMHGNPSNGILGPKGTAASCVLSPQRFKDVTTAIVGESPDFHRAFSLLSTNSWGSCEPVSNPFDNMHGSRMNMSQTPIHAVPLGSFPSLEYSLEGQPSTYPRVHSLTSSSRGIGLNEGFQCPNMSYGMEFYFRPLHY